MSEHTMNFSQFLLWERSSRDSIDLKKTYIDMVDDLIAGLLLSQIIYWYLPGKDGQSKLRVRHDDKEWIAKARYQWWDEIRITPKQFDRAVKVLEDSGIVETARYKFNNSPTKHIRIVQDTFLSLWDQAIETVTENPFLPKGEKRVSFLPKGEKPGYSPKVKKEFTQTVKTITETTAKTTSETTKDFAPTGASEENVEPSVSHTDLIKTWLDTTKIIDPSAYKKKAYHDLAKAMLDSGVTTDDIQRYVQDKRRDKYWATKAIMFGTVAAEILVWKGSQPAAPEPEPVPVENPARPEYPFSKLTEEQHQAMDDAYAIAMRKLAG